jgi:hypothetical protein
MKSRVLTASVTAFWRMIQTFHLANTRELLKIKSFFLEKVEFVNFQKFSEADVYGRSNAPSIAPAAEFHWS